MLQLGTTNDIFSWKLLSEIIFNSHDKLFFKKLFHLFKSYFPNLNCVLYDLSGNHTHVLNKQENTH